MRYRRRCWLRFSAAPVIAAVLLAGQLPVKAATSESYLDRAQSYAQKGDLAALVIELRNAERAAPQEPHIHALLAQAYLKIGDFASAEREARSARALNGAETDYLLPLAEAMLRQGKFADVQAEIKPGVRPPAVESKISTILGMAALGRNDRTKAEALLREAVSFDESAPGPKITLARLLVGTNVDEAEKLIDQVLIAYPNSAEAIAIKGEVLSLRGNIDGAMQRFDQAITIDPKNVTAHLSRANIYLTRNDYVAVDRDLDLTLKFSPNNFGARYLRALEYFKQRDFVNADKLLSQLSPTFSYMAEGLYVQAATKYVLQQYGQAEDYIAKYVARVPRNPYSVRLAALVALKQNKPDLAVRYLTAYLSDGKVTADPVTLTLLGNVYSMMKQPALALEQYRKAASLDPENLSIKTRVAASEIDAGSGRQGLDELERVYSTEEGLTVAGPTLVLTDLRDSKADEAAAAAEKLVARNNKSELYQILLGISRTAQRNYPAAQTIFEGLVTRDPDFFPAITNLAHVYAVAGRNDDAEKILQDFLHRHPNDAAALLALADLAVDKGDWDKAIDYVNQGRAAAPSDPAPALKLLDIYVRRHDWSRAKPLTSSLTAQFPSDVRVFEAQARMLLLSGDQAGAAEAFRHAYELAPESAPVVSGYLSSLAAMKKLPEEKAVLRSQLDKDPKNQEMKAALIRIEAEIGGLTAGLARAQTFAQADPGNSSYDIVSAELYETAGKSDAAVDLLQKTVAAYPQDDNAVVALARAFEGAGNLDKGEVLLTDRLKDRPHVVILHKALADLYIEKSQFDLAISEETGILSERENDPITLNDLAWLYQQVGNLSKAREFAEKAAVIAPASGSIEDTLGWVMLAQGDTEKGLSHLEAAAAAMPANPDISYHVAVALERAGRPSDARVVLEKLLGSGSSFVNKLNAKKLLDELKRG